MQHPENNELKNYNYKGYLFFFSGQLVSILGSSIASFVVVWWITITTGSAIFLTLSSLAVVLPTIIFSSFFGPLIDRWNRKLIIFTADLIQAILSIGTFLIIFFNVDIIFLLLLLFLRGVFGSIQTPALWSIIPQMVPPQNLSKVNSLRSLTTSMIQIIAPVVSAILLTLFPLYNIILIDIVSFIGSLFPLLLIRIPDFRIAVKDKKSKPKYKTQLIEGFTFLKKRNGLIPLLLSFAGVNVMLTTMSLMPLLIFSEHNGSANDLANVIAGLQIGILITSLAFTIFLKLRKLIFGLIIGIYGLLLSLVMIGFTPTGFIELIIFGNFVGGISVTIASISSNTLWQKIVPIEIQGRINSLRATFAGIAQPIGYITFGIMAEIVPISFIYSLSGILGLILFTIFLLTTSIRFIDYTPSSEIQKVFIKRKNEEKIEKEVIL